MRVFVKGKSEKIATKNNQKFLRGPGAVFSKRAPGRRRHKLRLNQIRFILAFWVRIQFISDRTAELFDGIRFFHI
jgi:hypothetical protein